MNTASYFPAVCGEKIIKGVGKVGQSTYFISYTNQTQKDVAWAAWVCWVIENKLGGKAITQKYDFHVGDDFIVCMDDALIRSDFVVCILTRAYLKSKYCRDEWAAGIANGKKIIPVRFDECEPSGLLNPRIHIDLFGLDRDSARSRLIEGIKGTERPKDEPDFPSAPAPSSANGSEPDFPTLSFFNLPHRNNYFAGREEILSKIYDGLQSDEAVALVGLGGYGKTQTAVEYAYRHASDYKLIWYFNAESERQLEDDYREFAVRNLNMENARESEFAPVLGAVENWFRANSSYLLIYENAESFPNDNDGLKRYLPAGPQQKHIIINSRERLRGVTAKRLDADVFSMPDAVAFVQKRVHGASGGDAEALSRDLGCLPLALECAVAYIEENDGYTLAQYLRSFKKRKLAFLDEQPNATDYDRTILNVWGKTFEKITQEAEQNEQTKAALQLFRLCTYCAPDNIPLNLFINGRGKTPQPLQDTLDPEDVPAQDGVLRELLRYSLISVRREDDSVFMNVHRLIQEVARQYFGDDEEWAGYCLDIADTVFDYQYGTRVEFDEFTVNLPHIIEITRSAESLLKDDEPQEKISSVYNEIGFGLYSQGEYDKALGWFDETLKICEKILGLEHPNTATANNNIANIYRVKGEYDKALARYNKALKIHEKVLGLEHSDTATAYNNIAGVYCAKGEYDKALMWYDKTLKIDEKVSGTEHLDTATTYNNIAHVYHAQGEYDKALEWYNKALKIRENALGTDHLDTATTYNNIAGVYHAKGEYDKARDLLLHTVIVFMRCNLINHPHCKSSLENLYICYDQAGGKEDDFEAWFQERLETYPTWCDVFIT